MTRRHWSTSAAVLVAAVAGIASYTHQRDLALRAGQAAAISSILPLSVDGLLVVATVAIGDGRRYRWSAWLAFWAGVLASVIANVLDARPGLVSRCVSAWPAVALLLVVEVIHRSGRRGHQGESEQVPVPAAEVDTGRDMSRDTEPVGDVPAVEAPSVLEVAPAGRGRRDTGEAVRRLRKRHPDMSREDIARRLGVSVRTVSRHLNAATPAA